jgi:hypothetical protein
MFIICILRNGGYASLHRSLIYGQAKMFLMFLHVFRFFEFQDILPTTREFPIMGRPISVNWISCNNNCLNRHGLITFWFYLLGKMVDQESRACLEDNFTGGIKQLLIRKYMCIDSKRFYLTTLLGSFGNVLGFNQVTQSKTFSLHDVPNSSRIGMLANIRPHHHCLILHHAYNLNHK